MKKSKDYFKAICKVSQALGTTQKYKEILNLIVHCAVETMDAKAAALFLDDKQKEVFVPVAQTGLSETYLHAEPHQAKKEIADVLKGGHLAIRDTTTDTRLSNHESKKKEGVVSLLVVPVMVKDRVIGVLSLYTATQRNFSADEIDFLKALAEQGGMAIENAKLIKRIRKNAKLFLDLASNINSSLEIKKILHNLTVDVAKTLGMKGVIIRLLDKDDGTLKLVASHGLSQEFLNKGLVSAEKSVVQALNGETVYIQDATSDDRVQYPAENKKEGIASMLTVPIKSKNEVIGIMRLCSEVEREFPEDVILLVNALAAQGGVAIQNASMYLRLQEDKKSLEQDIWSYRSWF
jgi:GAF domain-containing protein